MLRCCPQFSMFFSSALNLSRSALVVILGLFATTWRPFQEAMSMVLCRASPSFLTFQRSVVDMARGTANELPSSVACARA